MATKSYQEFKDKYLGKHVDVDGFPANQPYQCWDLVCGVYFPYIDGKVIHCRQSGYVKDIANQRDTNGILDFCVDVGLKETLQPGDICIWGVCAACPYSHIAIYDHDEGQDKVYFLGQNQPTNYVNIIQLPVSGIIGVFRPKMFVGKKEAAEAKAAKKAGRTAAEGVITVAQNGNKIALVEVNSETDFCAKNAEFVEFAQKVADVALANSISDIEALKNAQLDGQTVAEGLTALVAKIGENLQVRRVSLVNANADETVGVYVHSNKRIGVAVVLKGGDTETAKHVAMHVCAAKPQFVKPEDVSADVVEHERQVQIEIAMNSGKPQNIAEKMVEGRMKKFTGEISLTGQQFVMNPEVTVGQMLKEKGADAVSFVRLEVGEGIEKQVVDFAAEVQAQVAAAQK